MLTIIFSRLFYSFGNSFSRTFPQGKHWMSIQFEKHAENKKKMHTVIGINLNNNNWSQTLLHVSELYLNIQLISQIDSFHCIT